MSPLRSRIVVSLLLLPVVLGLVYLGGWWLTGLAFAGGLVALHELYTIARGLRPLVLAGFTGYVLSIVGVKLGGETWLVLGILSTLPACFLLFAISSARQIATAGFGVTMLGVAWVAGGLGFLILLRDLPEHGRLLLFTVLLAVFAGDTAAFVVGRTLGRHRMAPAISPGKTWEGFAGGTVAAIAVSFFALYEQEVITPWESVWLGLAVAAAAAAGDLFQSAVKRDLGVKDSGRFLGGHGGVLDRLDALLWAGPVAFAVLLALT